LTLSSLDTNTFRGQYIVTGGIVRAGLRASAAAKMFVGHGKTYAAPSLRASYLLPRASISAFFEGKGIDSSAYTDVTARVTPFSFVSLMGSVGRASDNHVEDSSFTTNYARAELGLRIHNLWFVGGVVQRDSVSLRPPIVYDTLFVPRGDGRRTGMTAAIRGQLWRVIHTDISALRWTDTAGLYRPQYQIRSELFVRTNLLDRFPSGNLGSLFSAVHEYRSGARFPIGKTATFLAPGYRTISTLLEIRILSATVSWQFRNLLGERYSQVPPFIGPRQTNFYGVRWEFLN
ncbi:MAG: hypothetical protein ACREBE_05070, partial [bacterium]